MIWSDDPRHNHLLMQDLTELPHLHEPGVLAALSTRYDLNDIYTAVGGVNFADCP